MTKLDDTLQVIIENLLAVKISFTVRKTLLVSFNHHKNYFLVLVWAFEKVLKETLFKNFLHFSIVVVILFIFTIRVFILVLILFLMFISLFLLFFFTGWVVINRIVFALSLLNFIIIVFDQWGWSLFLLWFFFLLSKVFEGSTSFRLFVLLSSFSLNWTNFFRNIFFVLCIHCRCTTLTKRS